MENDTSVFLGALPWVIVAIIAGILGCIALYQGNYRKFFASSLFVKAIMWLPLYVIFWLASYSLISSSVFALLVAIGSVYEWKRHGKLSVGWYLIYFLIGCVMVPVSLSVLGPRLWMAVLMAAVLSDVTAFFAGKALGRHRLPASLNDQKSIEGVIGQIVGGFIGISITSGLFNVAAPGSVGLFIGLLCAGGDLMNSFIKRKLHINDWGHTIPGHGGVMDRFSSLYVALIGTTLLFIFR